MPSVDVPVALLGYGTVGAAVHRLLEEQGEEIERATGHRLRVVRALVRDTSKERAFAPAEGVLTTDVAEVIDDSSIRIVAEVMGGVDPAGGHVLALLGSGRSVVTANKQLVARQGAELFAAAAAAGAQLRFEASVCAAIPVVKVLRESLVPVVMGLAVGLGVVVVATTRLVQSMLSGVTPHDAPTILLAALGLIISAWIAAWLPSRRASGLDPRAALRCEYGKRRWQNALGLPTGRTE